MSLIGILVKHVSLGTQIIILEIANLKHYQKV